MMRVGSVLCAVAGVTIALLAAASVSAQPKAGQSGGVAPAAAKGKELLAIMDLAPLGATEAEASALTERLREELLNTGRYTLVDRAQMKQILEEQAFQQAACTSTECMVQAGRILGVRKLVTGKATKLGDDRWVLSAQIVDVETAQTERVRSVPYRGDYFGLLLGGVRELAEKLSGAVAAAEPGAEPAIPPAPVAESASREPAGPPAAEQAWAVRRLRLYWIPLTRLSGSLKHAASGVTEEVTASGMGLGINYAISSFGELFFEHFRGRVDSVTQSGPGKSPGDTDASGSFTGNLVGANLVTRSTRWSAYGGAGFYSWSFSYDLNDRLFSNGQRTSGELGASGLGLQLGARYDSPSGVLAGAEYLLPVIGRSRGSRSEAFADNDTPNNAGTGAMLLLFVGYAF